MTTTITSSSARGIGSQVQPRLTLGGLVRAERIKLASRVSTYWVVGIIAATMVVMAITMAIEGGSSASAPTLAALATAGTVGAQFAAVALGAFAITGEYRTGQIRSTFNADPGRTLTLVAKAMVVAAAAFAATLASTLLAAVVAVVVSLVRGSEVVLFSGDSIRMVLGAAVYIAAIGVLSLALGALLKRTGGAIFAALAILWLLPGGAVLLPPALVGPVTSFLPASVGATLYSPADGGATSIMSSIMPTSTIVLPPVVGLLVLLAYVALAWGGAVLVTRRRDV